MSRSGMRTGLKGGWGWEGTSAVESSGRVLGEDVGEGFEGRLKQALFQPVKRFASIFQHIDISLA